MAHTVNTRTICKNNALTGTYPHRPHLHVLDVGYELVGGYGAVIAYGERVLDDDGGGENAQDQDDDDKLYRRETFRSPSVPFFAFSSRHSTPILTNQLSNSNRQMKRDR